MSGKSLITEPLGLFGWKHLEPVILASLITEMPMLLVGKHGSAKSFILERLAESLGMKYRFYDASNITNDDLFRASVSTDEAVSSDGQPISDSIEDLEVVFFDNLERSGLGLRNDILWIIHEKRVGGTDLKKLKYRWAAVDPLSDYDSDDNSDPRDSSGATPLDPAQVDRFPFIVSIPDWDEMKDEDRARNLAAKRSGKCPGSYELPVGIETLISEGKETLESVDSKYRERAQKYVLALMCLFEAKHISLSTQRATMFVDTLLAIHASKLVLNSHGAHLDTDPRDTCLLQVQNTLPTIATRKVCRVDLIKIADLAVTVSGLSGEEREILLEKDPLERLVAAAKHKDEISTDTLISVIDDALRRPKALEKRAVALICYLQFRERKDLPAAVMQSIVDSLYGVLQNRDYVDNLVPRVERSLYSAVRRAVRRDLSRDPTYKNYLKNLLVSGWVDGSYSSNGEVDQTHDFFQRLWMRVYGA